MITNIAVFFAITILVAPVLLVKTRHLYSYPLFIFFVIGGFAFAQITLDSFNQETGFSRESQMERVLQGLVREEPSENRMLLIGSSYSSRGIDGKMLERLLKESGSDIHVHQLSYPGVFAYEADFYLDQYLRAVSSPPEYILIEIGTEHSIGIKEENKFAGNIIRYHDNKRAYWMIRQALNSSEKIEFIDRCRLIWNIASHFLANVLNIGLIQHLGPSKDAIPLSGYQPEVMTDADISLDELSAGLRSFSTDTPQKHPYPESEIEFRKMQAEDLFRAGVEHVLFFQPPFAGKDRRERVGRLCMEIGSDCLWPDAYLYSRLKPEYWTDMGHLNLRGSKDITHWLAGKLLVRKETNNAVQ